MRERERVRVYVRETSYSKIEREIGGGRKIVCERERESACVCARD